MLHTLLVANRGEVASRVFRTARRLGLRTVAVHSTADASLAYVDEADLAVCIGEAPASASYLDVQALLDAARRSGADAIHPGWGFLAERADFAAAVEAAGLVWVGPRPETMRALGDKAAARALAEAAGVPVVPGYHGADRSIARLAAEAARIGYPLLVKAAAGGGGRGMRRVDAPEQLEAAVASAQREAQAAFGDDAVLLERLVPRPRHLEVQVVGDGERVVHLFERECSVQRRHQKVLEEAPAPGLAPALREALCDAAVRLASQVGYRSAGTVEFIVGADGGWAFLEMNTRLQVEHEVTECVTGTDLVALQLHIADGGALPLQQGDVALRGHAIEARVYAEDPLRDWLPTHGRLVRFDVSADRLGATYRGGDTVTVHYDPMLARVIATGDDRATATRRLARSLERAWCPGLTTNLPLLRDVARHPAWAAGDLHTGFLAEHGLPHPPPVDPTLSLLGGVVQLAGRARDAHPAPAAVPPGFRVGGPAWEEDAWSLGGEPVAVRHRWRARATPPTLEVAIGEATHLVTVHGRDGDTVTVTVDGLRQRWRLAGDPEAGPVYVHDGRHEGFAALLPRFPPPAEAAGDAGSCVAPTPGTVRAVHVAEGDRVAPGALLVSVEAMKMEHAVRAPAAGVVEALRCAPGDTVDAGALLVKLRPDDADDGVA